MKKFISFSKKITCLFLAIVFVLVTTSCAANVSSDKKLLTEEPKRTYENEMDIQVAYDGDVVSYSHPNASSKVTYNKVSGEICYIDKDGTFPVEITNISVDGIVDWQIKKQTETLKGQINTMESPSPQMAITMTIAGSALVEVFVYCVLKAAVVVTVAGTTCYLATAVADTLEENSQKYNYFPAYIVGGNVYIATGIGLTKTKAVKRIKKGQNVWAKNAGYAYLACVEASPVDAAEYGWHGNKDVNSGYYPHYHAVKYYKSNGKYVHTGAHCWFM